MGILYDIIHAHSLDGDTAAALVEYALSEHRFCCVFIVFVISMSAFNVYDFYDNFIDLLIFSLITTYTQAHELKESNALTESNTYDNVTKLLKCYFFKS